MTNLLYTAPVTVCAQVYLRNLSTTGAKVLFPFSKFGISGNKVGLLSLINRLPTWKKLVYFCINEAAMKWCK